MKLFSFAKERQLFSVDDGFVNCVPTSSVQTPVIGGVLVAIDSNLSSLYFFVCINAHGIYFLTLLFWFIAHNAIMCIVKNFAKVY